jgi:hypothetical protein
MIGLGSVVPINPGPIIGAGRRNVLSGASTMPNMRSAINGWVKPITMIRIRQRIVEGESQPIKVSIRTTGVIIPMKESLVLKKEGDRSWKWSELYTTRDLDLETNDLVEISQLRYKVMSRLPYDDFSFRKFELIQNFT